MITRGIVWESREKVVHDDDDQVRHAGKEFLPEGIRKQFISDATGGVRLMNISKSATIESNAD